MLAVFHLLPVPEIIVPKNSAMSQLLTERAYSSFLLMCEQSQRAKRQRGVRPQACGEKFVSQWASAWSGQASGELNSCFGGV